jgi:hypothetical protein
VAVAVVLSPFLALPLAAWLPTRKDPAPLLLALIPAGLTAYFGEAYVRVATGGPFVVNRPWAAALDL